MKNNAFWIHLPCHLYNKDIKITISKKTMKIEDVVMYGTFKGKNCDFKRLFISYKIRKKIDFNEKFNVAEKQISKIIDGDNKNVFYLNDGDLNTNIILTNKWYCYFNNIYSIKYFKIYFSDKNSNITVHFYLNNVKVYKNPTVDSKIHYLKELSLANSIEIFPNSDQVTIFDVYVGGVFNSSIVIPNSDYDIKYKNIHCGDYKEKLQDNDWLPFIDNCLELLHDNFISYLHIKFTKEVYLIKNVLISHLNTSTSIDITITGSLRENDKQYMNIKKLPEETMRRICSKTINLHGYFTNIECLPNAFGKDVYISSKGNMILCELQLIGEKMVFDDKEILLKIQKVKNVDDRILLDCKSNVTSLSIKPLKNIDYYSIIGGSINCSTCSCKTKDEIILFEYNSILNGIHMKNVENLYSIQINSSVQYIKINSTKTVVSIVKLFGNYERGGNYLIIH